MADSTASIKSLYSGRGDFSESESENISGVSSIPLGLGERQSGGKYNTSVLDPSLISNTVQGNFASSPTGHHRQEHGEQMENLGFSKAHEPAQQANKLSVPQNIGNDRPRTSSPGPPEWYANSISSTNISLVSSLSEYQSGTKSPIKSDHSDNESALEDSQSRPLSRNSTTSAFSMIATKDGVEGKKPQKSGVKPLLGHMFASKNTAMMAGPHGINTSLVHGKSGQSSPEATTASIFSSEEGRDNRLKPQLAAASLPPISLDEKIKLMNSARVEE